MSTPCFQGGLYTCIWWQCVHWNTNEISFAFSHESNVQAHAYAILMHTESRQPKDKSANAESTSIRRRKFCVGTLDIKPFIHDMVEIVKGIRKNTRISVMREWRKENEIALREQKKHLMPHQLSIIAKFYQTTDIGIYTTERIKIKYCIQISNEWTAFSHLTWRLHLNDTLDATEVTKRCALVKQTFLLFYKLLGDQRQKIKDVLSGRKTRRFPVNGHFSFFSNWKTFGGFVVPKTPTDTVWRWHEEIDLSQARSTGNLLQHSTRTMPEWLPYALQHNCHTFGSEWYLMINKWTSKCRMKYKKVFSFVGGMQPSAS